jgi:hypothetical protein
MISIMTVSKVIQPISCTTDELITKNLPAPLAVRAPISDIAHFGGLARVIYPGMRATEMRNLSLASPNCATSSYAARLAGPRGQDFSRSSGLGAENTICSTGWPP